MKETKFIRNRLREVGENIHLYKNMYEAFSLVEEVVQDSSIFQDMDLLIFKKGNSHAISLDKMIDIDKSEFHDLKINEVLTVHDTVYHEDLLPYSYLFPIFRERDLLAVIFFQLEKDQKLNAAANDIIQIIAAHLKYMISHFQVLSEQHELLREMDLLHEISQKITERKELSELLNELMESSKTLMNAEASSLLLYDENENHLYFLVADGERGKVIKSFTVEIGSGIAGWVAEHKEALLIEDCYKDHRFNQEYDKKSGFRTKSMICVPMIYKNNLVGVMQVINRKNDEIFQNRDLKIFSSLASQAAVALENARLLEQHILNEAIHRELETARRIQENLLPETLPEIKNFEIVSILTPAEQVGGDFYDVIRINENYSIIVVTDVAGKGIPAALIVSTIYSSLYTYLENDQFDLITLVERLNRLLIKATTPEKYATMWFGLIDHKEKTIESVNAGHNPPYLYKKAENKVIELKSGGIFLGSLELEEYPYQSEKHQLESGDIILSFTDGVTEAWNIEEEDYGEDRLLSVFEKSKELTAQAILKNIQTDVKKHVDGAKQSDDFTCLIIKHI